MLFVWDGFASESCSSIAQHANKLAASSTDRQDQDVIVTVPQANVPQIVEDLGAVSDLRFFFL